MDPRPRNSLTEPVLFSIANSGNAHAVALVIFLQLDINICRTLRELDILALTGISTRKETDLNSFQILITGIRLSAES